MGKVYYSKPASADFNAHVEFIARDNVTAASTWIDLMESTCEMIAKNPEVGQLRKTLSHGVCRSFVQGNYVIFFRGAVDGVEIVRIVRAERDIDRF